MWMSNGEIAGAYRDAKDKDKQIKILAQLNLTTEVHIKNILAGFGYDTGGKTASEKEDCIMDNATEKQPGFNIPESVYCAIIEYGTVLEMKMGKLVEEKKRIDAELTETMNRLTDQKRFIRTMNQYKDIFEEQK